jgi:hypothetical protein
VTPREELHNFIDQLDADAQPLLHETVDGLPDALIPTVLERMRFLRARLSDPSVLEAA